MACASEQVLPGVFQIRVVLPAALRSVALCYHLQISIPFLKTVVNDYSSVSTNTEWDHWYLVIFKIILNKALKVLLSRSPLMELAWIRSRQTTFDGVDHQVCTDRNMVGLNVPSLP